MCVKSVHCSLCTDVEHSLLVSESAFIKTGCHRPFDLSPSKKQSSSRASHVADLVDFHS